MTITIGGLTLDNPSKMTVIKEDRDTAFVRTYSSVAFFSWGSRIYGKTLVLQWGAMAVADFNSLHAIYITDGEVVFDPNDGTGRTFNVNLSSLVGAYHMVTTAQTGEYRKDVELELLIMSEV